MNVEKIAKYKLEIEDIREAFAFQIGIDPNEIYEIRWYNSPVGEDNTRATVVVKNIEVVPTK